MLGLGPIAGAPLCGLPVSAARSGYAVTLLARSDAELALACSFAVGLGLEASAGEVALEAAAAAAELLAAASAAEETGRADAVELEAAAGDDTEQARADAIAEGARTGDPQALTAREG